MKRAAGLFLCALLAGASLLPAGCGALSGLFATPTPVPRPTSTPAPSMAADEPETDENIFVFPTAIPEGGAPTGPVYEDLPEDIWAES